MAELKNAGVAGRKEISAGHTVACANPSGKVRNSLFMA
jgi:hypothetical protein